jgi:hypothetical protein
MLSMVCWTWARGFSTFALLGRPRGRGDWRGGGHGGGQCRVLGTRDTYSAEQIDTMHVTASNDHMEEAHPQQK